MSEPDNRTINSEGAPFGPILAKMLHDEVGCVRGRPDFNDAFRIAAILDMAARYIDAVVEGKGPANHPAPTDAMIAMLTKALDEAADSLSNANRPRCARKARAVLGHVERGTPMPAPPVAPEACPRCHGGGLIILADVPGEGRICGGRCPCGARLGPATPASATAEGGGGDTKRAADCGTPAALSHPGLLGQSRLGSSDHTTEPLWVERDGKRVWSEGWQANRGVPYTPGMLDTLRFYAKDHFDRVQAYNDDPKRVGPEKCPESVWVMADRLLAAFPATPASAAGREGCGMCHEDGQPHRCGRCDRDIIEAIPASQVDVAMEKFYEAARATWDARRASQRIEAAGCSPKQSDDAWALACACGEKERAAYDALLAAEAATRGGES